MKKSSERTFSSMKEIDEYLAEAGPEGNKLRYLFEEDNLPRILYEIYNSPRAWRPKYTPDNLYRYNIYKCSITETNIKEST